MIYSRDVILFPQFVLGLDTDIQYVVRKKKAGELNSRVVKGLNKGFKSVWSPYFYLDGAVVVPKLRVHQRRVGRRVDVAVQIGDLPKNIGAAIKVLQRILVVSDRRVAVSSAARRADARHSPSLVGSCTHLKDLGKQSTVLLAN